MSKTLGFAISVEGVDGSGKDTAIKMIRNHLEAAGKEVVVLADLYDTNLGIKVREIFVEGVEPPDDISTMMLVTAARRELLHRKIMPAILAGKVVLLNRFKDSTIAYQCFARAPKPEGVKHSEEQKLLGPHMAQIFEAFNIAGDIGFEPKHTLLITIDPEVQQQRMVARGKLDRYDAAGIEWHKLVQEGFNWIVHQDQRNRIPRITLIDNSTKSLEDLDDSVASYVKRILEQHK